LFNCLQLRKIEAGEMSALGGWLSEDRLPDKIQPARDATAVTKDWKNESKENLYKIELEVKKGSDGVLTNRGIAGPMFDSDLSRKLPGGVVQHQIINKADKENLIFKGAILLK
jgi:hypothetical protein